jgi:hypothetical protein
MKKHIILSLILLGAFVSSSIAQTQYFYEFSVPGLTTKTDASNITKALNKLDIFNLRVDYVSGKTVCFSDKNLTDEDFATQLNNANYFPFFFHKGIQGSDSHFSKNIEEWNKINSTKSTEKVFVVLGHDIFNSSQKTSIKTLLESKSGFISLKYSNDNKKLLIYTDLIIDRAELKSLLYSYNSPNKLTDLIEIYK